MANYTCGDGKTYATIQAGIDAIPGNLSGHGKEHVQVYAKAAGYAEVLDVSTGFSNASDGVDFVDVEAMVSHRGLRGQGIVLDCGSVVTDRKIQSGDFSKVHGFCLTWSAWKAASDNILFLGVGSGRFYVYDNICYDCNTDAGTYFWGVYFWSNPVSAYNNQFMNICNTSGLPQVIRNNGYTGTLAQPVVIVNNVMVNIQPVGCHEIYGNNSAYHYVHNNFARLVTLGGANSSITYNISSDATADDWGGAGNLVSKAAANQFVSVVAGSEILYPKRGSFLLRDGADMSAYLTRDCRGLARVYEDEPYFTTGAIHVPPARVVANLTNRRGNLRPNCYHETI